MTETVEELIGKLKAVLETDGREAKAAAAEFDRGELTLPQLEMVQQRLRSMDDLLYQLWRDSSNGRHLVGDAVNAFNSEISHRLQTPGSKILLERPPGCFHCDAQPATWGALLDHLVLNHGWEEGRCRCGAGNGWPRGRVGDVRKLSARVALVKHLRRRRDVEVHLAGAALLRAANNT